MRSFLLALGAAAVLLAASPAHAQFANRSIGFSAGYLKLNEESGYNWGLPVGLFGSAYLDNGFDLVAHFNAMFLTQPLIDKTRTVVGLQPTFGVRYLFSQEHFRPYVGLDLSYLRIVYDPENGASGKDYVGVGPNAGLDVFFNDAWSLGVRAQYNLYLWLDKPPQSSFGATLDLATWY